MGVNGVALGASAIGAAFLWGGLTNRSPLQAIQFAVAGTNPATISPASTTSDPSLATSTVSPSSPSGPIATVIAYAEAQVGKKYVFGAAGPDTFDCSGLVMMAYKQIGINLPHFTGLMLTAGKAVDRSALIPGDLVFPDFHHVQLYVGGGQICEAADAGIPIRVVPMWGFYKARRVYNP